MKAWVWGIVATMLLAGCAGEPTIGADGRPAEKLDSHSIRVGAARDGDYLRWVTNISGERIEYSCSLSGCDPQIVDAKDQEYTERWISAGNGTYDAWLRPVMVNTYRYRFTDLTPEEGERGTYTNYQMFDVSTGHLVSRGNDWYGSYTVYTCQLVCIDSTAQRYEWNNEGHYFPRDATNVSFGDVSGQVLRVGQTTSFHDVVKGWDDDYHVWVNYSAVRIVNLHDERTMLVKPETKYMRVHPVPDEDNDEEDAPTESPTPTPGLGSKSPVPTALLWFNSTVAGPVKEQRDTPFFFNGQWHWYNYTTEVVSMETGRDAVAWGQAKPSTPQWLPNVGHEPVAELLSSFDGSSLTWSPSAAEAWLSMDPTAIDYQAYRADHPLAYPFWQMYYPDPGHSTYTWTREWGIGDTTDAYYSEVRLQATPLSQQTGVTQSSGGAIEARYLTAATPELIDGLEVASGKDLLAVLDTIRPDWSEPAVEVPMFMYAGAPGSFEPRMIFHQTETLSRDDPVGLMGGLWGSTQNVAFSLRDGGLLAENGTFTIQRNVWPWVPCPQCALFGTEATPSASFFLRPGADVESWIGSP